MVEMRKTLGNGRAGQIQASLWGFCDKHLGKKTKYFGNFGILVFSSLLGLAVRRILPWVFIINLILSKVLNTYVGRFF
jgi:hypothetical protein